MLFFTSNMNVHFLGCSDDLFVVNENPRLFWINLMFTPKTSNSRRDPWDPTINITGNEAWFLGWYLLFRGILYVDYCWTFDCMLITRIFFRASPSLQHLCFSCEWSFQPFDIVTISKLAAKVMSDPLPLNLLLLSFVLSLYSYGELPHLWMHYPWTGT